jgi:hypothetical protein
MKTVPTKKTMRVGDLIAAVYHAHGRQKAKGILRLAFSAHLVTFRSRHPNQLCLGEPLRHPPPVTPTLLWRTLSRNPSSA